jgi:metal-dependent hydrolase (beta-lactamase superfamily II)
MNTLCHAMQLTGENRIYAVMGGSHLMDVSDERLWQTIAALRDLDIKITVLAVKDRVLAHNSLAALYNINSYYRRLRSKIKTD